MKDIILINPPGEVAKGGMGERSTQKNPPLGLAYLAAVLLEEGYSVDIIDMGIQNMDANAVIETITKENSPVAGISSLIGQHGNAMRLAAMIKRQLPDVKVIMGGPMATFIPGEILRSGNIDMVCMFEGEETIKEIMDYYTNGVGDIGEIRGIAYEEGGKTHINPRRPFIENLDSIPYPARDLFMSNNYEMPGTLITGRGCPHHCIFCSANALSGSKYRRRSPENVLGELDEIVWKYGIDRSASKIIYFADDTFTANILIADDTFTANKKHCIAICRGIREHGLDIAWGAESRADTAPEDAVREMAKAGCTYVQIGAESANDEVSKKIRKGITAQQIRDAAKLFGKYGIYVLCSFIIGLPFDTKETIKETMNFALDLFKSDSHIIPTFAILTPIPGTYLYEHREELGIKLLTDKWDRYTFHDPVVETRYLTKEDQQNLFFDYYQNYFKQGGKKWQRV